MYYYAQTNQKIKSVYKIFGKHIPGIFQMIVLQILLSWSQKDFYSNIHIVT